VEPGNAVTGNSAHGRNERRKIPQPSRARPSCLGMGGVVTVLRPHGPMGNTASIGRWPLVEVPLGGFHIHAAGAV
jgi:hypothetical protein